jgi:hypothetical protein
MNLSVVFTPAYLRRHRAQVRRNLEDLLDKYKAGKITRAEYNHIHTDGRRALAELDVLAGEYKIKETPEP